jgi:hypothetical protein
VCACADDERSGLACSTAHCGDEGPRRARPSRHAASPRYGCIGLAGFEDGTPECSAPGTSASAGGGAAGRPISPGARRDASGELSGSEAAAAGSARRWAAHELPPSPFLLARESAGGRTLWGEDTRGGV